MILICAWHKPEPKVMGEVAPFENTAETHGICPQCAAEIKRVHLAKKGGLIDERPNHTNSEPVTERRITS